MDKIADLLVRLLSKFIKFEKPPQYLSGKNSDLSKHRVHTTKYEDLCM